MSQYFFDLYSSRGSYADHYGDRFESIEAARRMARTVLIDFAKHQYPAGEECLVVCKIRTPYPERYYIAQLSTLDEPSGLAKCEVSDSKAAKTGGRLRATEESEVAYRMSADWATMNELKSDGFLRTVAGPRQSWLTSHIPPDEHARVRDAIGDAIRHRAPFELEHRVIRADKTIGWTSSRALPVVDEDGRVSEWIGVAKDVSARHAV